MDYIQLFSIFWLVSKIQFSSLQVSPQTKYFPFLQKYLNNLIHTSEPSEKTKNAEKDIFILYLLFISITQKTISFILFLGKEGKKDNVLFHLYHNSVWRKISIKVLLDCFIFRISQMSQSLS